MSVSAVLPVYVVAHLQLVFGDILLPVLHSVGGAVDHRDSWVVSVG